MLKPRPIVIAYDISKNKTRSRVYKILKEWRIDGQKSVHECRLTQRQAEELFLQLNEFLNNETDRLMIAWLEPHRTLRGRGLEKSRIMKKIWHVK